jgi:nucleotide-binding universal stress UspA family protein
MKAPENAVVVGVGADGSGSALRFAVAEARRTGRPLHLVHVLQLPAAEAYAGVYGGALENARRILDEALARAEELGAGSPPVPVTGSFLDSGWVVDDLVRSAPADQLLVLQHRALGRVHRLFTGSLVHAVAGRAHVPVVSVPEGWVPRDHGVVTAAVQDPVEAPALLREAFAEAAARRATLVVLHAWWLDSGYDDVVVDDQLRERWEGRTRQELAPVLSPLRAEHPEVEVVLTVRHAPAVEAVLDAADHSDVLVLGRRHHVLPVGSHLGPVARAALGHSTAPVLITPEVPAPSEGERDGTSSTTRDAGLATAGH